MRGFAKCFSNLSYTYHLNKWSVSKERHFTSKWDFEYKVAIFLSRNAALFIFCWYLAQSGGFWNSNTSCADLIGNFVGLPSFFPLSVYYSLGTFKSNNLLQILMKNDEKWYPTLGIGKLRWQKFKRFNSPWTNSICFFCLKVPVTSFSYLNLINTNWWEIVFW